MRMTRNSQPMSGISKLRLPERLKRQTSRVKIWKNTWFFVSLISNYSFVHIPSPSKMYKPHKSVVQNYRKELEQAREMKKKNEKMSFSFMESKRRVRIQHQKKSNGQKLSGRSTIKEGAGTGGDPTPGRCRFRELLKWKSSTVIGLTNQFVVSLELTDISRELGVGNLACLIPLA